MNFQQLEELTISWILGDKFLFTFHFQKWREELNLPVSMQHNSKNMLNPSTSSTMSSPKTGNSQSTLDSSDVDDAPVARLVDILREHHSGKVLLETSSTEKLLTDEERQLIISLIAQHFHKNNLPMSLSTSYKLEKEILDMFPKEKLDYYRTERRGKIYAKYHNSKRVTKSITEEVITPKPTQDKNSLVRKFRFGEYNFNI